MATTKPGAMATSDATKVRSALTAADSTTINDANFPPGDATNCAGAKRVLLVVRFTGGTTPTATIEPLVRMGTGWAKLAKTAAIGEGVAAVVETYGRKVYFRVDAVTGTPTSFDVYCGTAEAFRADSPRLD